MGFSQQQANYELAQKFYDFTLGGKLSHNSLSIYPREINDTDNFWFEFQTTVGKEYYYVMPAAGKREPLFDKGKMAMQLSEFTKGVVDKNKLDISSVTFSKDQRSFVFDYSPPALARPTRAGMLAARPVRIRYAARTITSPKP